MLFLQAVVTGAEKLCGVGLPLLEGAGVSWWDKPISFIEVGELGHLSIQKLVLQKILRHLRIDHRLDLGHCPLVIFVDLLLSAHKRETLLAFF